MGICASKPQVGKAEDAGQEVNLAANDASKQGKIMEAPTAASKQLPAALSSTSDGQTSPGAGSANGASSLCTSSTTAPKASESVPSEPAANASISAAAGSHATAVSPAAGTVATSTTSEFSLSARPAPPSSGRAAVVGSMASAVPPAAVAEAAETPAAPKLAAKLPALLAEVAPATAEAAIAPATAEAAIAQAAEHASNPNACTNSISPQHSALSSGGSKTSGHPPRSVKFAEKPPLPSSDNHSDAAARPRVSWGGSTTDPAPRPPKRVPGRSQSGLIQGTRGPPGEQLDPAVLAKQVEILRSNKMGKLRQRRGGLDSSFAAMQEALAQDEKPISHVNTRAAGLKHIGFGPFKRENQDEFFIQVGEFGGLHSSNLFCVFDGHGTYGKDAALYSRQLLPRLLDVELTKYFQRLKDVDTDEGLKGAVEVLITEVFGETERSLSKFGVNLASSGTTASVAYQKGNRLWVASAGDSRAILCCRVREQWRALPLTIDHRPRRDSERERIEAAGARVAPKRLPSGRTVGEPRLWLQNASGPGLLLSRSLGDLTAATVGCTSDPEVSFTTLRPGVDHVLVMATDGVWDVLTNEQVCDIVVESPDPHIACRRVLDAALYEWEERMSADNITVLVVEFDWGEEGSLSFNSMEHAALASSSSNRMEDTVAGFAAVAAAVTSPVAAAPGMT